MTARIIWHQSDRFTERYFSTSFLFSLLIADCVYASESTYWVTATVMSSMINMSIQRPFLADTVEKLRIFQPGKTICVLTFLSNLTHGGGHSFHDLLLQRHC